MDKVNRMKEQMGNVSKEMEILRKSQKELLETKNTVTEMKNAFDGLISSLDMCYDLNVCVLPKLMLESLYPMQWC